MGEEEAGGKEERNREGGEERGCLFGGLVLWMAQCMVTSLMKGYQRTREIIK